MEGGPQAHAPDGSVTRSEVEAQLVQILASPAFARAPRMQRFLGFLVEEWLAGRGEQLKEYAIAVSVFEKPADFDPGTSAVIRVEAGRLRRMLAHYYREEGREDRVLLDVPKGTYVPVARPAGAADDEHERVWLAPDERRVATILSCAFGDEGLPADAAVAGEFLDAFDIFHGLCSVIAIRHGGTVDGGASDRLIVYFGWPDALEDSAGRAVTAALDMIAAVREALDGDGIGVRVAIATSEVVVRPAAESGEMARPNVVGQAPLLATAMLRQAPLNGVLVAEQTRRLTGSAFDFVPAGTGPGQQNEGPLLWRLLGPRAVATRFRARHEDLEPAIIGRREELALIENRLRLSLEGEGQIVAILGEAGIGKSMLAETAAALASPETLVLRLQCSPHHASSSLYPVVEQVKSLLPADTAEDAALAAFLEQAGLQSQRDRALLKNLVSERRRSGIPGLSASQIKDMTLQLVVRWLAGQAERRPLLLLVEDVHWGDPTTLELLQEIAAITARLRLTILLTSRGELDPALTRRTNLTSFRLARLAREDCNRLIDRMASAAPLSATARGSIMEKAEGIPLFLEELTKLFLAADIQHLPDQHIPASLNDLLASQLGRLGPTRRIAQVASVIGRQFSRRMLALAAGATPEEIELALDRLLAAGIVLRSGSDGDGDHLFRHALLRDAAYESILPAGKAQLHGRVADILIGSFPELIAERPEVAAAHLTSAGRHETALTCWTEAGAKAASRYALAEAMTHYREALAALAHLPDDRARSRRELELLIALGQAVRGAHGYGDAELLALYERARQLAEMLNDRPQVANAIYGLWTHNAGIGNWPQAVMLAQAFETLVQRMEDSQLEVEAYRLLGASAAFRGDLPLALHHFDRATLLYDPRVHGPGYGFDPGAASFAYLAWVCWHMGDREAAREHAARALAVADAKGHPSTQAMVLSWLMFHAVCEGDLETIAAHNRRLQTVCEERDCRYWQPFGSACAEWAAFEQDGDMRRLDRLVAFTKEFRERYFTSCLLLLAADICLRNDLIERGLALAEEARRFIEEHDERLWDAECDRLTAELLLRSSRPDGAKAAQLLRRAAKTAARQGAIVLEQRALARLAEIEGRGGGTRPVLH